MVQPEKKWFLVQKYVETMERNFFQSFSFKSNFDFYQFCNHTYPFKPSVIIKVSGSGSEEYIDAILIAGACTSNAFGRNLLEAYNSYK